MSAWADRISSNSWTLYYGGSYLPNKCLCFILHHADTIYACQDKRDDVQAGVKSTALLFGAHVKKILAAFATSLVTCLAVVGALNNQGIPYFILTVGGAAAHLTMQLRDLDVDDPKSCLDAVRCPGSHVLARCTNCEIVRVQWIHSR